MDKKKRKFKMFYKKVEENEEVPFEVLCMEMNLRLEALQYAIKHHTNEIKPEELMIQIEGKIIFPLKVFPGNIGPYQEIESAASLKALFQGRTIGVGLTQQGFNEMLEALRKLSDKYGINVDIRKGHHGIG